MRTVIFCNSSTNSRRTMNLPHGHESPSKTYHTDTKLTTRTTVLPHGHQTYHTNTSLLQNLWVGQHPGESHHLGRIWQFSASAFHLVKSQKNVESPRVLQQSRSSRRISHGLGSNSTNHQSASYRYGSTQLKCGI